MRRLTAALLLLLALGSCTPTIAVMGPPVAAPRIDGESLVMADGAVLPMTIWRPDGEPKAVILALHGFNDYAIGFADPAVEWVRDGIATYAYDQRGFGRTAQRGLWPGTETLVADLETALTLVSARHPGVPVYVLGESMSAALQRPFLVDPKPGANGSIGTAHVAQSVPDGHTLFLPAGHGCGLFMSLVQKAEAIEHFFRLPPGFA